MQANLLRLVVLSALLAGATGWSNGGANDPFSAEKYYSSPMKFVGEKIKVRVFKIEPRPNLTAADLGSIVTVPFVIYHFYKFATYSLLMNLLAVPLMSFFMMPLAIISLLLMPFNASYYSLKLLALKVS